MQLVYVNAGLFLSLSVTEAVLWLFGLHGWLEPIYRNLSLSSQVDALLMRPWTLVTHMFVHRDFLHGIFNLLWLYFSGTLFLEFLSQRQLLSTYLIGGLFGAVFFVIGANAFPAIGHGTAIGASAAILALLAAAATLRPNWNVYLALIGAVPLKYLALVLVLLDVIFMPYGNAGGHLGHLGGAMFGTAFGWQLRKGRDLSVNFLGWVRRVSELYRSRRPELKVLHRNPLSDEECNERRKAPQDEVDAILDKIRQRGYDSLTAKEKDTLFKASKGG